MRTVVPLSSLSLFRENLKLFFRVYYMFIVIHAFPANQFLLQWNADRGLYQMMNGQFMEGLHTFGPIACILWALTIAAVLHRPQRYLNCVLLLGSLLVTWVMFISMLDNNQEVFLMASILILVLFLFLVPVLLIINGIQMIRKESFSLAHILSLALGVFVGIGEIATVAYVLDISSYMQLQKASYWILFVSFTVFYFSFLILSFVMYTVFIQIMPHRMNFDYVIIHGCGLLDGERMTKLLSNRVDKAIRIYNKCKVKPMIIPSGGKGPDEKISEAQAMKNYLLEHGIPEEHIIMEDGSATTKENLINSKAIIESREGGKKTALVSSNYHIYRCLRLARETGLKCTGIGADVAFYYWPSALIREFIAVFLTPKFLFWSLLGYPIFITPVMTYLF